MAMGQAIAHWDKVTRRRPSMSSKMNFCITAVRDEVSHFAEVAAKDQPAGSRGAVWVTFLEKEECDMPYYKAAVFLPNDEVRDIGSPSLSEAVREYNPATHIVCWITLEEREGAPPLFSRAFTIRADQPTGDSGLPLDSESSGEDTEPIEVVEGSLNFSTAAAWLPLTHLGCVDAEVATDPTPMSDGVTQTDNATQADAWTECAIGSPVAAAEVSIPGIDQLPSPPASPCLVDVSTLTTDIDTDPDPPAPLTQETEIQTRDPPESALTECFAEFATAAERLTSALTHGQAGQPPGTLPMTDQAAQMLAQIAAALSGNPPQPQGPPGTWGGVRPVLAKDPPNAGVVPLSFTPSWGMPLSAAHPPPAPEPHPPATAWHPGGDRPRDRTGYLPSSARTELRGSPISDLTEDTMSETVDVRRRGPKAGNVISAVDVNLAERPIAAPYPDPPKPRKRKVRLEVQDKTSGSSPEADESPKFCPKERRSRGDRGGRRERSSSATRKSPSPTGRGQPRQAPPQVHMEKRALRLLTEEEMDNKRRRNREAVRQFVAKTYKSSAVASTEDQARASNAGKPKTKGKGKKSLVVKQTASSRARSLSSARKIAAREAESLPMRFANPPVPREPAAPKKRGSDREPPPVRVGSPTPSLPIDETEAQERIESERKWSEFWKAEQEQARHTRPSGVDVLGMITSELGRAIEDEQGHTVRWGQSTAGFI